MALSIFLTVWVSELLEEVRLEQLISTPSFVRIVLQKTVQNRFDLVNLEIIVVVAKRFPSHFEKRKDFLSFRGFQRLDIFDCRFASEFHDFSDLIDRAVPRQQSPSTVQLIDQTPKTPHIAFG